MALEPIIILNGIFAIVLVLIYIFVGIKITQHYKLNREKTYIFFGLTWIGLVEAWYAGSISFIVALFNGVGLSPAIYFMIGVGFYPVTSILWILAFSELLYKEKQKIFVSIYIVIGIIYEIIFYSLLIKDPSLIGDMTSPVDARYGLLITVYVILILAATLLVTGFIIGIRSVKSNVPEHKLRGIFLIIAIISFFIGSYIDSSIELDFITLTITRVLLISSAFEFYCGFILPKWIKKLFLKAE